MTEPIETSRIVRDVALVQPRPPLAHHQGDPDGQGGTVLVVADGYKVERLNGPEESCRRHIFDDLRSFAAWIQKHAGRDPGEIEILVAEHAVAAILDPHRAVPEIVTCALHKHPIFEAWEMAFQAASLNQRQFHALARGFKNSISNAEGLLSALSTLGVAKTEEVRCEIDERGALRVNVSDQKRDVSATIPSSILVILPILEGIEKAEGAEQLYTLDVLVSMDLEDVRPRFALDCADLPVKMREARRDAAAMLQRLLGDEYTVGLGTQMVDTRKAVPEPITITADVYVPTEEE